ncbi:MAG: leucyl/phenylalanyl-tRNA--protein transferase [Nitrospira sp.]|nr:leucyl/phenylalanyl-tRNA--protein transferase [Nitrospira sp.]
MGTMLELTWIDDTAPLPATHGALGVDSDAPGLLCAGGRLDTRRLEEAYRRGVFPWYGNGQPVLWWTPDPRMVLPVRAFRLSRSMTKTLRRFIAAPDCEVRVDHDAYRVIGACAQVPRENQRDTWIVPAMVRAYSQWHDEGRVHSFETWIDGELAGGLYGVGIGRMFFGESMFSWRTDASKIALAALVAFCRAHGIELIDCQQHTRHLASFGAREIPRAQFEAHLASALDAMPPRRWTYDAALWAQLGLEPHSAAHEATAT